MFDFSHLPVETVTGPAFVGAVAFIVDWEDAGGTLRPKVEPGTWSYF